MNKNAMSENQARTHAHISSAMAHIAAGQLSAAEKALKDARNLTPEHPQIHFLLAELAVKRDNLAAALGHATEALGWERKRPEPFALMGRLLHLDGDSPLAARFLERALELAPGFPPAQDVLREVRRSPRMDTRHPELEPLSRRPTISLAMIVKNEASSIGRCLVSARPHVDEIIVVDTGSTDETAAIAEVHGAKVLRFQWVNDFAAARNFGIDACTSDWILVMDADEEIEVSPDYLKSLIDGLPWPDFTGLVPIVSVALYNHSGSVVARERWEMMPLARIFPRSDVRYRGAAHETPELKRESSHTARAYNAFKVVLHHFGYRPEVMQARDKLARNIPLIKQRVAEHPDDYGAFFLLGRELIYNNEFEAGLQALDTYLKGLTEPQKPYFFRLAYYLRARAMVGLNKNAEAVEVLRDALKLDPDFPTYHFYLGDILYDMERYAEAVTCYEAALANHDYHDRHPIGNYNALIPAHTGESAQRRRDRAVSMRDAGVLPESPYKKPDLAALSDALEAFNTGDLIKAQEQLDRARMLNPGHPQVPYLEAELAMRNGDIYDALQRVFASLKMERSVAEPWALAGYLLHEDEDSELAVAFLKRALAISPNYQAVDKLLQQVTASPRNRFRHPEMAAWYASQLPATPLQGMPGMAPPPGKPLNPLVQQAPPAPRKRVIFPSNPPS